MKGLLFSLLCGVAFTSGIAAAAEPPETEFLWQTLEALQFPRETRAPFRETRSSKLLRKPAQQTGTLWIEDGGDFVMQILEPRREERRLSEERLSLKRGKKTSRPRSVKLDRSKGAHQLLLCIVDVLEGNVERLQASFDIAPGTGSPGEWVLTLTPLDSKLRRDLQQLVLRGHNESLLSLRAERTRTSWQEIEILPPNPKHSQPSSSD